MKVKDIIKAIEDFAPTSIKEDWDNPGLQVGNPEMDVTSILLCLDITEEILDEAIDRGCNLVITHHPLLFKGLKHITGATNTERITIKALKNDIAIYAAHTNLDCAWEGVSHEMAHALGIADVKVLDPHPGNPQVGLGVVGNIKPVPTMEFLRRLKKIFHVRTLRYSANSPHLVVRRVALCGGAGISLISKAIAAGADIFVTGDVKYHDITSFGQDIVIADIGHFESELCTKEIFARLLREAFPEQPVFIAEKEENPIASLT